MPSETPKDFSSPLAAGTLKKGTSDVAAPLTRRAMMYFEDFDRHLPLLNVDEDIRVGHMEELLPTRIRGRPESRSFVRRGRLGHRLYEPAVTSLLRVVNIERPGVAAGRRTSPP